MRHTTGYLLALFRGAFCLIGLSAGLSDSGRAQDASFPQTLRQAQEKSEKKDWAAAAPLWEKVTAANPVNADFWEEYPTALYS